jgi:predicted RNase H-like HicB family nuclease
MTHFKFVVEQHPDGFVAYPLGMLGVVVGEGDTADEALSDAKSAAKFHIDTFGAEALPVDSPLLDAFIVARELMRNGQVSPKSRVLKGLGELGVRIVREGEHISLRRENED